MIQLSNHFANTHLMPVIFSMNIPTSFESIRTAEVSMFCDHVSRKVFNLFLTCAEILKMKQFLSERLEIFESDVQSLN